MSAGLPLEDAMETTARSSRSTRFCPAKGVALVTQGKG